MANIVGSSPSGFTSTEIVLIAIAVTGIIILLVVTFLCFCREHLIKNCPCMFVKKSSKSGTVWHHVDRFGETKIKFAVHSLLELRTRSSCQNFQDGAAPNGGLQPSTVSIPVFEEKHITQRKKKSDGDSTTSSGIDLAVQTASKLTESKQQAASTVHTASELTESKQ